MVSLDFSSQLSGHVFQFLLVFTRMGAGMMLFPGIGESFVPMRLRLVFSFALTLVVYGALLPMLPPIPKTVADLGLILGREAFIGIFFGSMIRLLMDMLETAGSVIAVQTGLSNAMILNPTQATQSSLSGALLGIFGLTLLFASGLDYFLIEGLVGTYSLFPIDKPLLLGDMAQSYARLATLCFEAGVELSAPFLVIGLLLYVALGMIQRMMPQVQLFMVILPLQIWGGLMLFAAVITAMGAAWLGKFDSFFATFMGG